MEIKRTVEIVIATKRKFVVPPPGATAEIVRCPQCAAPVVLAEDLAWLLGVSRRRIYRIVERGARHFVETGDGLLYVCAPAFGAALTIAENIAEKHC